jgi:acyl-CoA synthetase (AMP-forming)/AMP-acid ligase II
MNTPFNILDFLDRAETVFGDRIGIVDEPNQPTPSWGELTWRGRGRGGPWQRARRARRRFGERVAIVSHNSARMMTALLAVSGYGRVVVPINFRLNAEEVRYIVEHSGASMLLVDPELDEALADVHAPIRLVLGEESDRLLLRYDRKPEPWYGGEDATASINYTSGTTARPKGVELTHRNLYVNALTLGWHTGVDDRDVYLWSVPMFHCNGWGMVYAITGMGGRHVILRKVDGLEILRRVEKHGVTFMGGAPAVVSMILTPLRHPGGSWRPGKVRMVAGGAPPPTSTIERLETGLGWELIQLYGLTETSPVLTVNRRRAEWAP